MKTRIYYYIGIIIVGIISTVVIFSSMPSDTWRDHRTGFVGVSTPDEINEKIDCLSRGGIWEHTSCSINESEPRITGKMAQEICSITGGECPPNYPVNIQEDGSEMVIVTTWDADTKTEKQFVFVIKNKTLSYEERVNGKLVPKSIPEPEPEPEPTYTLTEVHCFPNQVIYNDECIYVLNPTDEFPKEMTKYFLMVDNEIINFCVIESTTSQDRENTSGVTLDRCFEISHYRISDVNEIEFQSTTPPTWINIKLEDLTRNVELGSSPTFTVVESGWWNGCTSPTLEIYHLKQEIGHDEYTDDDLVYKHQIVYSCPYYEPTYPPRDVLRIWDESDFPNFPICEEQGRYLIVGDSGYERLALDYYYCGIDDAN